MTDFKGDTQSQSNVLNWVFKIDRKPKIKLILLSQKWPLIKKKAGFLSLDIVFIFVYIKWKYICLFNLRKFWNMYRIYKIYASGVKCFWADGYIPIYHYQKLIYVFSRWPEMNTSLVHCHKTLKNDLERESLCGGGQGKY